MSSNGSKIIVVPKHFRISDIEATDHSVVNPAPSAVRAVVSDLFKLLILPILTGCAYGLAYAYELGYFDSLGIPSTLLTVELGRLAIPGLLGVGVALMIGFVYKTHLEFVERDSFAAKAYLWGPPFILAELLWPKWGGSIVIVFFLQYQANKSQRRWLWEAATIIWLWILAVGVVPKSYLPSLNSAALIIIFLIMFERWAYWRALTLSREGRIPSQLIRYSADFRLPRSLVRRPASGEGRQLHDSVAAAAIGLSILLISVLGLYRLGYYSGQQQEYYLVVDQTSKNPRIVAKQYGDRTIEGSFNMSTLELTGEWRMVKYSDSNPMVGVYKKLGHLKHKDYPGPQPLDAIYRNLKSYLRQHFL